MNTETKTEYRLVQHNSPKGFSEAMNMAFNEGFMLSGELKATPCQSGTCWSQAMIRMSDQKQQFVAEPVSGHIQPKEGQTIPAMLKEQTRKDFGQTWKSCDRTMLSPEQQRQAQEVTRMFSEQSRDMKAATPQTTNPDMPHMDRCPVCNGWQFDKKCSDRGCPRHHEETFPPKTSNLSFSQALEAMKQGKKVRRKEWPGTLRISISGNTIMQHDPQEGFISCGMLNFNILAEDWEILP